MRTGQPYGLANCLPLVAAEIVQHDDIAGLQSRHQRLLDPGTEPLSIDRPVEQEGRLDAINAQCGEEGIGPPAPVRGLADQPCATLAPAPQWRHVGLGPGFVDEDQAGRVDALLMALPTGAAVRDLRSILFGRECAFF